MQGIVPNLPEAEYRNAPGANWSTLKHFRKSPAHVKHSIDNPGKSSSEQSLGIIQHCAICEPEVFLRKYFVLPEFQWNSNQAKADAIESFIEAELIYPEMAQDVVKLKKDELIYMFCEGGKVPIERSTFESCLGMSKAIWANKYAKKLIEGCSLAEAAIFWIDPATGVECKGRVDLFHERLGYLIDLKTTDNAAFHAFRSSIERFDYAPQLTHYKNGLEVLGKRVSQLLFLAVESSPPHGVAIYALSEGAINTSKVLLEEYLRRWQFCTQHNKWPSYQEEPQDMDLSERGYNKLEAA